MSFTKMDKTALPPRQWALVSHPGMGKSTFATQMKGPILPIDADHRFSEVAHWATGDVFQLSDEPTDNANVERINVLLKKNMPDSGIKTIVVDSLTSIMAPIVTEIQLDNDAGRNKNMVAAFAGKALALRLLQDSVTSWGVDTLWIFHLRMGRDEKAKIVESTTISAVELARLRRSLNMQLRIVEQGGKRGVTVDWARRGRSGMTLFDDTGCWRGMPERIELEVYGGLTIVEMQKIATADPVSFTSPEDAIGWGFETGLFKDACHAKNAYEKCKEDGRPTSAAGMWSLWLACINQRREEQAKLLGVTGGK